ncbi:FecR family protein [Flavitalea sp. BT771]|uniref:FecR family protein n=1 Tax=Flavitalea sp. BT771 TaxID=3063329 RepID=UPI0026E3CBF7|nr:FecR family protein [Flavitalea sp. BT771]MDO6435176.1 FecR family protein [Flavitalea sp. BT771]MDV6224119.1 FecR family protein [Flavitalea sp. BT771]
MQISPERLRYLLQQYAADSCTRKELLELLRAVDEGKEDKAIEDSLQAIWLDLTGSGTPPSIDKERVFSHIISDPAFLPSEKRRWWPRRMAAAAMLILIAGTCAYFYLTLKSPQKIAGTPAGIKQDVSPGGNKAILTLADGSTILLDSAHNGTLRQQGTTKLIKLDSGQLAYQATTDDERGAASDKLQAAGNKLQAASNKLQAASLVGYNTITTPRGGQYQLVLPDGTRVWLNASSSLRFPTAFNGSGRAVDLAGEAYFEVAKEKTPFKVHIYSSSTGIAAGSDGHPAHTIEVLGTHFNVNAYEDEAALEATLLEGSIKLEKGNEQVLLRPGQQAISAKSGGAIRVIPDADVDAAIAWKNGYFQFEGAGIQAVMRQLARWYDVDVRYEGPVTERQFGGQMPRGVNLSEVLRILEESNVHFRIEGRKLVVMP